MPDEQALFAVFRRHDVPFVVIGGHAVNFHGYGRTTEDIDILWLRTPETEQSLYRALLELDARYIGKDIDPSTGLERTVPITLPFIQSSHLMMLLTRQGFLDLFDYVPGLPQENPQSLLTTSIEVDGARYVALPWLRKLKEASGRPKDQVDLQNLPD